MGENMDAGNTFAVMTAFAFLAVLPVAVAVEGVPTRGTSHPGRGPAASYSEPAPPSCQSRAR